MLARELRTSIHHVYKLRRYSRYSRYSRYAVTAVTPFQLNTHALRMRITSFSRKAKHIRLAHADY